MAGIFFLFCLLTASYTWIAAQEQVLNQFPCYTNFIRYPNRALLSSKISIVLAADVGECILHCAKESSCKSINFAVESDAATKAHRCELMEQDRYSEIEKFADSSVFNHYGPRVCSTELVGQKSYILVFFFSNKDFINTLRLEIQEQVKAEQVEN